ncbi:MAG TPA: hypothetical protein VG839_02115 [Asticcacaulis sp.]|nr:hypothetical protein [Asticcacaulis sp.]
MRKRSSLILTLAAVTALAASVSGCSWWHSMMHSDATAGSSSSSSSSSSSTSM